MKDRRSRVGYRKLSDYNANLTEVALRDRANGSLLNGQSVEICVEE